MLRTPSSSGVSRPIVTGTLTTSSTPDGCTQNVAAPFPSDASAASLVPAVNAGPVVSPAWASCSPPRPVTINKSAPAF